jgi:hypothetical protein
MHSNVGKRQHSRQQHGVSVCWGTCWSARSISLLVSSETEIQGIAAAQFRDHVSLAWYMQTLQEQSVVAESL